MVRVTFYYTGLSQCFCAVFKYAAIYVLKFQALFHSDFSCLDLAFCYCLLSSHCVVLLRAHVCKNAFPFQISMLGPLFYSISYCSQINLPQFPMCAICDSPILALEMHHGFCFLLLRPWYWIGCRICGITLSAGIVGNVHCFWLCCLVVYPKGFAREKTIAVLIISQNTAF